MCLIFGYAVRHNKLVENEFSEVGEIERVGWVIRVFELALLTPSLSGGTDAHPAQCNVQSDNSFQLVTNRVYVCKRQRCIRSIYIFRPTVHDRFCVLIYSLDPMHFFSRSSRQCCSVRFGATFSNTGGICRSHVSEIQYLPHTDSDRTGTVRTRVRFVRGRIGSGQSG